MKHNEILTHFAIEANIEKTIELDRIYPLGIIEYKGSIDVQISCDNKSFERCNITSNSFKDVTAKYIKLTSSISQEITIYLGLGYYAETNPTMSNLFEKTYGWTGADGIYSFNLEHEEDYDQKNDKTLFVFGDTFYGATKDLARIELTAMVNNSFGYYKNSKIDFVVNKTKYNSACSLFEPNEDMLKVGYLAKNLTNYSLEKTKPFVSALNCNDDVVLNFDLHGIHTVNTIIIENFDDTPELGIANDERKVKVIDIYSSEDGENFKFISKEELSITENKTLIAINTTAKVIRFVINKNENIKNRQTEDDCVGLNKVYFYDNLGLLNDVTTTTNQEFYQGTSKMWYWLQDGIIVNNSLYIFPLLIEEELNGIEGFEFKMDGTAYLKMPIENKEVKFNKVEMRLASPLYKVVGTKEYVFPTAIMREGDYAYFYGYCNERDQFLRHLILARIPLSEIDDLNNLMFFDGKDYIRDITKSKFLVSHVSCEMSVQKIVDGENKGKYLAVFHYDTNGPCVAYAIGDTKEGPFTSPRIIYVTKEPEEINKGTTYTYNAKSHLHLSSPRNILVSYNVNDMSMKQSKLNRTIYHPRFLNFIDTSND